MKNNRSRSVGVFFTVNNKKFVTTVDYRSKGRFKKLIEDFSKNAKIYNPKGNEKFMYIDINVILENAYEHLDKKANTNKLIYSLMAQNSDLNV